MALILDIDMAVNSVNDLFTGDEMRGRSLVLSMHKLRSPLISSSESDKEYYIRVKRDSDRMDEDEPISSTGNSQDEYMIQERKKGQVSKTADIKNIKESLCRMGNYIKDKSVNSNPNDIKDLDSMGKVVSEFLSTVYMWTTPKCHSEIKSNPSSTLRPLKLQSTIKVRRLSSLLMFLPSLHLFWQKLLKKLMRFQNTSRRITILRRSHMLKLLLNLRAPILS